MRCDRTSGDSERIIECGNVVRLQCEERIHPGGLEPLCEISKADRIKRLGTPVLANKGQIRRNDRDVARAMVSQGRHEKEQHAEPVLRASSRIPVETRHHADGPAVGVGERTDLEFAVAKVADLERTRLCVAAGGNDPCHRMRVVQPEDEQGIGRMIWSTVGVGARGSGMGLIHHRALLAAQRACLPAVRCARAQGATMSPPTGEILRNGLDRCL